MLPTATDLKYFLMVAETLNIGRAAGRLRLSQPSLSTAIRRLESSVGAPLLIRGKTGVQLTQAGERLVPKARDLLETWEKISSEAARDQEEVRGRYILGVPHWIAFKTIPLLLSELLRNHVNLEINLAQDISRAMTAEVVNSRINFALVSDPVRHPDLVIRRIYRDETRLWVSNKGNPTQDPRSGQAILIYHPTALGQVATQQAQVATQQADVSFARTITTESVLVMADLVAAGVGIGAFPFHVAALFEGQMHPLPKELLCVQHDICLVYRADALQSPAVRKLVKEIETVLKRITVNYAEPTDF